MRTGTLAFFLGFVAIYFLPQLPNETALLVFFLTSAIIFCLKRCRLLFLLLMFGFGMFWFNAHITAQIKQTLPKKLENKFINISGVVDSVPKTSKLNESFLFKIKPIGNFKGKVKLSWYGHFSSVKMGESWTLRVKLKRPHSLMNPGTFDYEKFMFANGITATGYVKTGKRLKQASSGFVNNLNQFRQHLYSEISQVIQGPNVGIVQALSLGIRSNMTTQQWLVFQRTGTSHLVAISGLHVGLVAALIFFLVKFLWRFYEPLALWLPSQIAAAYGAILGAFLYSTMAGFSITAQRAVIMIIAFMLGIILKRRLSPWYAFCLGLFVVLLVDPFAMLTIGFWLSFSAVGILLYCAYGRNSFGGWRQAFRLQVIMAISLIPLTLWFFQKASLVSLAANLIAIPWVSFLVVPCCLFACVGLMLNITIGKYLFIVANKLISWLVTYLTWLSHFKWVMWQHSMTHHWLMLMIVIGMLIVLLPVGMFGRVIGLLWILPILFKSQPQLPENTLQMYLLDVGQGLATVVQTRHHVLIYDTGAKYSPDYDMGKAVVVPFLQSKGISTIDKMVISHGDNDHIGGANSIIQALNVKDIETSVPERFPVGHAHYCLAGQHWQWDGVKFEFLYPTLALLGQDNNSSCVLRITANGKHILFTGDIEKPAEKYLLQHNKTQLAATLLVAPHHASKTSSSLPFVKAVNPQDVLFPLGYLNRYRFPSTVVVQRYKNIHAHIFDTAACGMISFYMGNEDKLCCFRRSRKNFWQVINTM